MCIIYPTHSYIPNTLLHTLHTLYTLHSLLPYIPNQSLHILQCACLYTPYTPYIPYTTYTLYTPYTLYTTYIPYYPTYPTQPTVCMCIIYSTHHYTPYTLWSTCTDWFTNRITLLYSHSPCLPAHGDYTLLRNSATCLPRYMINHSRLPRRGEIVCRVAFRISCDVCHEPCVLSRMLYVVTRMSYNVCRMLYAVCRVSCVMSGQHFISCVKHCLRSCTSVDNAIL